MIYEYRVRAAEGPLEPMLNEHAEEGWRFVWCTVGMEPGLEGGLMQKWYVVFEREVEE